MLPLLIGIPFFFFPFIMLILFLPFLFLVFLAIGGLIVLFSFLSIKMTSYEVRPDGLFIRKGVIAKSQTLLLYSQIQDVSEFQGLWGKIVGLKTLQLQTMTTSSQSAGSLANLTDTDADELRNRLLDAINRKSTAKAQSKESVKLESIQQDIEEQQDESRANPYPLHYLRLALITAFGCIIIIVLLVVLFIASLKSDEFEHLSDIVIWIIFAFFVPIGMLINQFTFKYWLGKNTVTIKSGWINTRKTSIEYEKVQDFIIVRGPVARLLGLATVRLETGSAMFLQNNNNQRKVPNYSIPVLSKNDAEAVSEHLITKMGISYSPNKTPLVEYAPLSTKKVIKKTMLSSLVFFILMIITIMIAFMFRSSSNGSDALSNTVIIIAVSVFALLLLLIYIYQRMYLACYYYDTSKDTLTIRKGVIFRQGIYLPYRKIQNVFMDQDLLDRIFGLYDVHLSTVGRGSIWLCHIDGLNKENADKLVKVLLDSVKANAKK
jgi:membrane protein YdbS with pleckstrin-like domain